MSLEGKGNPAAVLYEKNAKAVYTERPVPKPEGDEMVVRNHAAAVNPVDWKIQDYNLFIEKYPIVIGNDICGVVEAVGPDVTKFKPGDRVTGFAGNIYNSNIDHGAFQKYPILREVSATKIPASMSFEEGSVFPMAMATACMSLFDSLAIPRPPRGELEGKTNVSTLLIWGGASSLGQCAIQIARVLGIKTFVTASTKHHATLKKLGAAHCFDYHDNDAEEQIAKAAEAEGTPITLAYDTISENGTLHRCAKALRAASQGSKATLSYVLWQPEGQTPPEGVQLELTVAMRVGKDKQELGRWFFNDWLQNALASGQVIPVPEIEIVPGGLRATQAAFDQLRNRVSGKKLVIQVD